MSRLLNICIVSREYPPDTAFGGIARVVQMEAQALAAAGHSVHVLTLSRGSQQLYVDSGVVVHRLPHPPTDVPLAYINAGAWSLQLRGYYARLDDQVHFDVVQNQAYYAEAAHLPIRPETLSVQRLHGLSSVINQADGRHRERDVRIFEAMEEAVLQQTGQLLLAPSQQALQDTVRAARLDDPATLVAPPFFDPAAFPCQEPPAERERLELLFLGRLEPLKGPAQALRTLARIHAAGQPARLTLVGRDVPQAGRSYRRAVLIPLMRDLGLDFSAVRFVEQVDADGVRQHLRHCDLVLCPSVYETAHTVTLEAVSSGRSIITGAPNGAGEWLHEQDGVACLPTAAEDFPERAAQLALQPDFRGAACHQGAARVGQLCDQQAATQRQVDAYCQHLPVDAPPLASGGDELAVIMLAHNQLEYTQVAVRSVLRNTGCPFTLYLVDNASTDDTADWAEALGDSRITVVRSPHNVGVSGGRNLGLERVWADNRATYVAFLDNDVEVYRDWWRPFATVLQEQPEVGITGERGVRFSWNGAQRVDTVVGQDQPESAEMVVGFCMFMREEVTRLVGRYDEQLGLFWHDDDDYCFRAARLGFAIVGHQTGGIAHFEHKSSALVEGIWSAPEEPSQLSNDNQTYLRAREQFFAGGPSPIPDTQAVALAVELDELLQSAELMQLAARAGGATRPVTLLLLGGDPATAGEQLQAAAEQHAVPELLDCDLLLPEGDLQLLGPDLDGVLALNGAVRQELHAPARFGPRDLPRLEQLIERRQRRIASVAGAA